MNNSNEQPSFADWFSLADGRKNFKTSPIPDKSYLLGEPGWEKEIDTDLKKSTLLGTPVHLTWWGQYGIGKTHRLRHIEYIVATKNYPFRTIFVTCSDIQDKTGFEKLHYEMINALGREETIKQVSSYLLKLKNGAKLPTFDELGGNSTDVSNALKTLGGDNSQLHSHAWQFLCGMELKPSNVALAGVTKPSLDGSHDFAAVTAALATVIERESGKQLMYLIDEAENIGRIINKNAESMWKESLRLLLDTPNINIVMTIGAERIEGLPKIITMPDIVRRIQKDNIRMLNAFGQPEASSFLKGLLVTVIDPAKRTALEAAEGFSADNPAYDPVLYPFADRPAFDLFCSHVTVDPRSAKPSEILEKLNHIAADAYYGKRRLITEAHLQESGIG